MSLRYNVRRPAGDSRYSVWDNLQGRIALFDDCECANLGFDEALQTAERLNGRNDQPGGK